MTTRQHKHRSRTSHFRPFTGPVADIQKPAAHGGVTYTETCLCGFQRKINVNGHHTERGPWQRTAETDEIQEATIGYTCQGTARGACGVIHRTWHSARACIEADAAACRRQGGNTDRAVYYVARNGSQTLSNLDD